LNQFKDAGAQEPDDVGVMFQKNFQTAQTDARRRCVAPAWPMRAGRFATDVALGFGLLGAAAAAPASTPPPDAARQQHLVRMVRQDCGSCHGMRLTGGLGPALTPAALADKPRDSMVATIVHGRPGTPMPPWRAMLTEADAQWIVDRLFTGFPDERPGGTR
jgi:cytochrome c55X